MKEKEVWDNQEWIALKRESALVSQVLSSGVTALGKANYADKIGEYYIAFFCLSIGFERLVKLIIVADFAISNNGKLPEQKILKKFSHRIIDLLKEAGKIQEKYDLHIKYKRGSGVIADKIIDCLDSFSDAAKGRYANFGALSNPNIFTEFEPVRKWWDNVGELILEHHYYGTKKQKSVESTAKEFHDKFSHVSHVIHFKETGDFMGDIFTASIQTGKNSVIQKYGRFHTLVLIRWLSDILYEIFNTACYKFKIEPFFGHSEYFNTYRVDDYFLKNRKIWPLQ